MASKYRFDLLRMDPDYESPYKISAKVPEAEQRKAYSALRSTWQKRYTRLAASKYANSPDVLWMRDAFPVLKDIKNKSDIAYRVNQLLRLLDMPSYSVSGRNEMEINLVKSLNAKGLDFVTRQNVAQFGAFMDYARSIGIAYMLDSDRIADLYENVLEEERPPEEWGQLFENYLEGLTEAEKEAQKPKPRQIAKNRNRAFSRDKINRGRRGKR